MTVHIARNAQLFANRSEGAPAAVAVTLGIFQSDDFSVTDLATGGDVALTIHRVRALVPGRLSRLQYRVGGGIGVDLPQPVGPGVTVIEGLEAGVAASISVRAADFDPETGLERFGDWSPAVEVTPTAFAAANLLSDTVDPVGNASARWDGATVWAGPVDGDGFASFTSASAAQDVDPRARPAGETVVLATVSLRTDGAATSTLSLAASPSSGPAVTASAEIDWADGGVSLTNGPAGARAVRIAYDAGAGTARLALEVPLADGATDALSFSIGGANTAFAEADLRAWVAGDNAWPVAEAVAGPTAVPRLIPPIVTGFGGAALEAEDGAPETLPFTTFGAEVAETALTPPRAQGLSVASVTAGGTGYVDGSYTLAADGGEGGTVEVTVSGGAVTGAVVADAGRRYLAEPSLDLSALPGGSGAAVAVSRGPGARDYWPALGEGGSSAAWGGVALGTEAFAVEGFVAEGGFRAAGIDHTLSSGAVLRVEADGAWRVDPAGSTDGLALDEGERITVGLVVTNGGTRAVLDLALGFAGDGPVPVRIVGTPMLLGSGRWGDRMVAMPGRVTGDGAAAATVVYEWLVDGAPVSNETGPTLRLTPDVAPLGSGVAVRIIWRSVDGEESWQTEPVTVQTWKVDADGGALGFGALTPLGLLGVPVGVAGTTISAGNGAGRWTLNTREGIAFLAPAVGPSTPGSDPATSGEAVLTGTDVLSLSDGRSVSVTAVGGTYTLGCLADLTALAQDTASAAGQGAYGFDFASGGTIALWNSGDWGHVEDAASPESALRDLVLVGGDADGGATQLVVAPYDAAEPTAVTGPVHLAEVRNLAWRVDLRHAPPLAAQGGVFGPEAILSIGALGRSLVVEDCTVQGPHLMGERLSGTAEPTGVLIGAATGGMSAMAGSGAPGIVLRGLSVADIARVVDGGLGDVGLENCRIARCGSRPVVLGAEATAVSLTGVVMQDALSATAVNGGAWVTVSPEGATGFDPIYRPGTAVSIEDCVFFPGQGETAAMAGVVLSRDAALGDGSAEADFGFVYSPLTLRRSVVLGGIARQGADALWLSSGETGSIEDVTALAEGRAPGVALGWQHGNGFRPLGGGFGVSRSVANASGLGAGISATDEVLLTTEGAVAALAAGSFPALAPRTLTALLLAFTPVAGSSLDLGGGASAGAIDLSGAFKGDLSGLPDVLPIQFGRVSWGGDTLAEGIGWGTIPEQSVEPFGVRLSRTEIFAPAGIHVELTGLTEEERLSDDVRWDFVEDYDFDALPVEARVDRSARFGRGFASGHVYRTPGTYEIVATMRSRAGQVRQATATVTVVDQEPLFAGTATLCYAPDGDFDGAPDGAVLSSDYQDVVDAMRADDAPKRILFRAGKVISVPTSSNVFGQKMVSRFGEGADPILELAPDFSGQSHIFRLQSARECTFTRLAIRGLYDVVNPAPPEEHPERSVEVTGFARIGSSSSFNTIVDVAISGLAMGIAFTPRMVIANCTIFDWYDYGLFGGCLDTAVMGCNVAQNLDAFRNDNRKSRNDGVTRNSADHGPMRATQHINSAVQQCFMRSTAGWSTGPGGSSDQPALRVNTSTSATDTDHGGSVAGNHLQGGNVVLVVATTGNAMSIRGRGLVVEGNYLEGTARTTNFMNFSLTPSAVRNNLCTLPDVTPEFTSGNITVLALGSNPPTTSENLAGPMRLTENTVLVFQGREDREFITVRQPGGVTFSRVREENNVFYAPNMPVPVIAPDPMPLDNFAPAPGSALLGAATGAVPVRDMRSALRGAPAALGALEPFAGRLIDFGSGGGAAALGSAGALSQSGTLTFAMRASRLGGGERTLFEAGADHRLALASPSDRLILKLAYDDGSLLVDRTLSGAAVAGDFVSILLAVDLAGGLTGGRTVSLWVDGVEVEASTAAARPLLADPAGLTLMGGTAAAELREWIWADTAVALDPALWWDAFFDADGAVRNLEPAGRVGSALPAIFAGGASHDLAYGRNRGTGPRLTAIGGPAVVI